MKINYNVHHILLTHDVLKDLKGKPLLVTWLAWCQIMHLAYFTKNKSCAFYQKQFSEDLGVSQNTTRAALKHLMSKGMIKCVVPYQRKTNSPGTYILTQACIRIASNLYQKPHKPVSPGDTVNNIKKYYKQKKDDVDTSPPSKKETSASEFIQELNRIAKTSKQSWEK